MIYIKKDSNFIEIPRHEKGNLGPFSLQLVNNLTKQGYIFENLADTSKTSLLYRFENIDFSELIDGEYDYCLLENEDDILELGLLTFGDYVRKTNQYQNKVNKVQYNG